MLYLEYMNILVTGGTGYIGSHTVVELMLHGHDVVIVDNLCNSDINVVNNIQKITHKDVLFHNFDLQDTERLSELFSNNAFDAVIHFAGLKAVSESVQDPLLYYGTNIHSTISLLSAMKKHKVKSLIFSSSATVYGSAPIPYMESSQTGLGITNPYGQTKYMIEQILKDFSASDQEFSVRCLRYFNPIGSHKSGLLEEKPSGVPNNIMPYIVKVARREMNVLPIFGDDYDTVDGTAERDYIHITDLVIGHVLALENISTGFKPINLGSGKSVSVMKLVNTFMKVNGVTLPYEIRARRAGDLPRFYANTELAQKELGWTTTKTIENMCEDSWHNENR